MPSNLFALPPEAEFAHSQVRLDTLEIEAPPPTRPDEPVEHERNRSLPGFINVVARTDRELTPPGVPPQAHTLRVRERVTSIRTRGDAHAYFEEVRRKTAAAEAGR